MSNIVKLQIPIDKSLRDKLARRAADLGFDSVQAYIRVWAKAEADGRQIDYSIDDWGEPSPEAVARLNQAASKSEQGIDVSEPFHSMEDMMSHLDKV